MTNYPENYKEGINIYEDLKSYEYLGLVKSINDNRMKLLHDIFVDVLPTQGNFAILAVGSDGKFERHAQSKTDLVIVCSDKETGIKVSDSTKTIVKKHDLGIEGYRNGLYYYDLSGDTLFSAVTGNTNSLYPDYLLNSSLIYGDSFYHSIARLKVLMEITGLGTDNDISTRIKRHMNQQLKDYRRAIRTGKNDNRIIYSQLDQTIAYYNEEERVFGLKLFLRAVQRTTDIATYNLIQNGKIDIDDALAFSTNTVDRLSELRRLKELPEEILINTSIAYMWMLQKHHQMQEAYKDPPIRRTVCMNLDGPTFEMYRKIILSYSNFSDWLRS